jgi:hypothetical protein
MKELADDLGSVKIEHRILVGNLDFAGYDPGEEPKVVPDLDIQNSFMQAGEQALPAADTNRIVIYWIPTNGSWQPVAVLIDCTEPLWRTRTEPGFENPVLSGEGADEADPSFDPSFRIVTLDPTVAALEVIAVDGSPVRGFLHSPGGTRTIVVLGTPATPGESIPVTLALHRPASTIFGIDEKTTLIRTLDLGPAAPWEDDHV